jgi:hypothetical protein
VGVKTAKQLLAKEFMCFDCDEVNESKRAFLKGATTAIVGVALKTQTFWTQYLAIPFAGAAKLK